MYLNPTSVKFYKYFNGALLLTSHLQALSKNSFHKLFYDDLIKSMLEY